jgi:hypothetical protein
MSLLEKLRAAREQTVTVGKYSFRIRRPRALEMVEMQTLPRGRAVLPFIIGWEGVTSLDLIPGGDAHPLPFDADVAADWLTDRLDLLQPLADAIMQSYFDYEAAQETARKN